MFKSLKLLVEKNIFFRNSKLHIINSDNLLKKLYNLKNHLEKTLIPINFISVLN